jgi:hypothetical protein
MVCTLHNYILPGPKLSMAVLTFGFVSDIPIKAEAD